MDSFRIDELARRLLERVPPALRSMQRDLESNFRAVLREGLGKLDLVTRDEFDAQTRVLQRTRARLEGLEAPLVHVEVSLASGLPAFCIVGLPATVVKESKERVRAALLNSRFEFPAGRITVNLAPADLPKEGGRFDLPIALGILIASGQIRPRGARGGGSCETREFYGELGLTGELKPVRGLLLAAAHAQQQGHELVVPRANAAEACVVAPERVRAAGHLLEVCGHLSGAAPLRACAPPRGDENRDAPSARGAPLDLADVRGQLMPKRALVIAAAGGHSLLMIGPPGSGKSMLAQRLPGLLPPLTRSEALEVAAIAAVSAAGFTPAEVRRYRGRISGPLLDRLDMHVEVPRVTAADFDAAAGGGESTAAAATRVALARGVQLERQGRCNARLTDLEVQRWCAADAAGRHLLEETMRRRGLSGRARARLLRLARTIADLEGATGIGAGHIAGAVMLRCMDASVAPARAAGAG